MKKVIRYFSISLAGAVFAVSLAELALRFFVFHPLPSRYHIWPPGLVQKFLPEPDVFPGIRGLSVFSVDENGFRSMKNPTKPDDVYLALGGSTTECLYLDDKETWPALLQSKLDSIFGFHCRIENGGRSGHLSRHHVLQMKYLLPQHPEISNVFLLCGINDLLTHLQFERGGSPAFTEFNYLDKAFLVRPVSSYHPFYKRSAIWHLFRMIDRKNKQDQLADKVQDQEGKIFREWRKRRLARTGDLSELPDLSGLYGEYRENIRQICVIAQSNERKITLITQPVMWQDSLPANLDSLLWTGGPIEKNGNEYYFQPAALRTGMDSINAIMREVALEMKVPCIDLAQLLSGDNAVFYDDCHFNEYGAERVAEQIMLYLKEKGDFLQSGRSIPSKVQ